MKRTTLLNVVVLLCLALAAHAADSDLPVLDAKVKTLAVFKNGLGFVFRSGQVDTKDGWLLLDELPPAALGTLWIGTPPPARVEEVVSYNGKVSRDAESISIEEILHANVGRQVTITYSVSEVVQPTQIEGILLSVPDDRKPEPPNPALAQPNSSGRYVPTPMGSIVLIGTSDGETLVIPKSHVRAIRLPKGASLQTRVEKEVNSAKIRVGGPSSPKRADITLAYLEKCITWSPSYLVNVADAKTADIALEAVLADDIEDLEDVDVSFVVGYPNFMFADKLTPLYAQQSVAQFSAALQANSTTGGYGGYASIMGQSMANTAAYSVRSEWRPDTAYAAAAPMSGESNEDLYFYHQPHVTLKKGDRVRYTVFGEKVPYEHIYTWDVPDSMNVNDQGGRRDSSSTGSQTAEQVWHSLRLRNTTKHPWTTAPAFTVNGSMPVAQDVMQYTPPTASANLRLTVGTDIKAEQSQTEDSRSQVKIDRVTYDNIVVSGKLTIRNLKSKPVKMCVKKSLVGEVLNSSHEGRVTRVARRLAAVNPTSEIEWEFELPAGVERRLTYKYQVLLYR